MRGIPSRLAFCLQGLAYFDEFYQYFHVCLFLTRYFNEKRKNKASFEGNQQTTRCRISLFFERFSGLFCVDIIYHTK